MTAAALAAMDADGELSLTYSKDPRAGWEWRATINVRRAARGVSKDARQRHGYGLSPEAAMRDLARVLSYNVNA